MAVKISAKPNYALKSWLKSPTPLYKYIHNQLIRLWKASVQEFIREAISVMSIDTGMSVASFEPLAAKVRLRSQIEQSLRGFGARRGHKKIKDARFTDNIGPFKSRALGQRLGEKAYELEFGSPVDPKFLFKFKIVVYQHYLQESTVNMNVSKNWQSIEAGKKAFETFFNENASKFVTSEAIINWLRTGRLPNGR